MDEKIILKETVSKEKVQVDKKPKKKYYKPKKKKEDDSLNHEVQNSEKPFVDQKDFKLPNTVGRYSIGSGKKFSIYMEKKPKWLHRKCMELFLGWEWEDNK